MITVVRMMVRDPAGRLVLLWAVAQIAVGTLVFQWLEGWSAVDSFYFSVVTLATVGFGDLHPTTDVGKLVTVAYIASGLGVIAAFISELTRYRVELLNLLRTEGTGVLLDPGRAGGGPGGPTPPATDDAA